MLASGRAEDACVLHRASSGAPVVWGGHACPPGMWPAQEHQMLQVRGHTTVGQQFDVQSTYAEGWAHSLLKIRSHSLHESGPWILNIYDGRCVTVWARLSPALATRWVAESWGVTWPVHVIG